jgi:hypothetical protein
VIQSHEADATPHTFIHPSAPVLILDYAGARPRRKLRLAARSYVDLIAGEGDDGRQVRLVETLRGKSQAVAAICFAVFTLLVFGLVIEEGVRYMIRRHADAFTIGFNVFCLGLWIAELATLFAVINETWRRTILIANPQHVILQFRGVFRRTEHRWSSGEIADASAVATQDEPDALPLGELRLTVTDRAAVHLFTDHRLTDVQRFAAAVRGAIAA